MTPREAIRAWMQARASLDRLAPGTSAIDVMRVAEQGLCAAVEHDDIFATERLEHENACLHAALHHERMMLRGASHIVDALRAEAHPEIERLTAKNNRLRAALHEALCGWEYYVAHRVEETEDIERLRALAGPREVET